MDRVKTMGTLSYTLLNDRGVLSVAGEDAREFLQGLVSNDMNKVTPEHATWAAFLTPQGKYLHDFFIYRDNTSSNGGETFLLDCEAERRDDLMRRLRMYRLRSKADVSDRTGDLCVVAIYGEPGSVAAAFGLPATDGAARAIPGGVACVDPRLSAAGVRIVVGRDGVNLTLESYGATLQDPEDYDQLRLGLGLPDGSRDMVIEKSVLLEGGFEELNGVDFDKGCYLGQELTARTKYRGLLKRRLLPVAFDGEAPPPGTAILMNGREAGEMRSSSNGLGLAILRLDSLERGGGKAIELMAGGTEIKPRRPVWATRAGKGNQQGQPSE